MEDQASSYNFLSVIFGILVIFWIEICGRKIFVEKKMIENIFDWFFFETFFRDQKKIRKKSYEKVNEKNLKKSKMTKYQGNVGMKKEHSYITKKGETKVLYH